eukprot:m.63173 g.63173  ORF g.63173 m.63173 type:complete len:353 (+) comp23251_c0_seq2:169-1227(+)
MQSILRAVGRSTQRAGMLSPVNSNTRIHRSTQFTTTSAHPVLISGKRTLFGLGPNPFGTYEVITEANLELNTSCSQVTQRTLEAVTAIPPALYPSYALQGVPVVGLTTIPIYTETEIAGIRASCECAREILNFAANLVEAGVTTNEINNQVHEEILRLGAYPSPLNYHEFPKSICTSINNVVCHGIPDDRPLKSDDIINIDVTVYLDGFHGDTNRTIALPHADESALELLNVGKKALEAGISACVPGQLFSNIGSAIETYVTSQRYSVNRDFVGHGIGREFHTKPHIYPYANDMPDVMEPGMVFTIEPCVNEGKPHMQVLRDGWTAVTRDRGRSCQFEHTLLITDDSCEILT